MLEFFTGFIAGASVVSMAIMIYSKMYLAKIDTVATIEDRLNERMRQSNSRILKIESEVMYLKLR